MYGLVCLNVAEEMVLSQSIINLIAFSKFNTIFLA